MATKKNSVIESGKNVAASAMPSVSHKAKKQPTELAEPQPVTILDRLYNHLQGCELCEVQSSINLSAFDACKNNAEVVEVVNKVRNGNAAKVEQNRNTLLSAASAFLSSLPADTEGNLFRETWSKRANNTDNFRLTFQREKDERTVTTFEDGVYYARLTSWTAAGLRTSFNSCEIARTAPESAKKRAMASAASKFLLGAGVPALVLDNMTDGEKINLARKMREPQK